MLSLQVVILTLLCFKRTMLYLNKQNLSSKISESLTNGCPLAPSPVYSRHNTVCTCPNSKSALEQVLWRFCLSKILSCHLYVSLRCAVHICWNTALCNPSTGRNIHPHKSLLKRTKIYVLGLFASLHSPLPSTFCNSALFSDSHLLR